MKDIPPTFWERTESGRRVLIPPKKVEPLKSEPARPLEKNNEAGSKIFCSAVAKTLGIDPERIATSHVYVSHDDLLQRTMFLDDDKFCYCAIGKAIVVSSEIDAAFQRGAVVALKRLI